MILGEIPIIGNNLLITFDDGMFSNLAVAEKILNPFISYGFMLWNRKKYIENTTGISRALRGEGPLRFGLKSAAEGGRKFFVNTPPP